MSIVLASILLTATVFAQGGPSQSEQGSDDDMMHHLVQYFMRVGTEQYERGYYIEAEKTFQMAQGYGDFLEPLERRKLASMLEKASLAAIERKRALDARRNGEQLLADGQADAARAELAKVRGSEFLTDKERAEVARVLDAMPAAVVTAPVADARAENPASDQTGSSDGDTLERFKNHIANVYYESVKAYHSSDLERAKGGFEEVLRSGLMPAPMAETIRGYLADIDGAGPAAFSAQPMVLPERPALHPAANTPGAGQPQSERQRIAQLYNRSWELYSQGELEAAREGFAEVARSGLYAAPEGKRPEDYIATIDRLLATSPGVGPAVPMPAAPQRVARPDVGAPDTERGGFIAVINRRRNIIRSHTQAVVSDGVNEAQKLMAQGQFDEAREPIEDALRVVNQNQLHLGDDLYKQYSGQLRDVMGGIGEAEAAREKQLAEQKRLEAVEAQQQLRQQSETDRQQKIDELMTRAKAYWKQQRYEAALGQVESLLAIEPLHDDALTLKQQIEDMIYMRKQVDLEKLHNKQRADVFLKTDEAGVPYAEEIEYPKNWREIVEKPTRQPDGPIGLDPDNMRVYTQLETPVDLSILSPEMPLSEAIGHLRDAVEPPLNIVVLWKDLLDNAEIEPTTPIDMDGLPNVRLGTALENLLNAVAGGFAQLDYVVNKGVITCATIESLPTKKMETRVYDITDLISEPANYQYSPMLMMMLYNWQEFGNRPLGEVPTGDGTGTGTGGTGGSSGFGGGGSSMGGGMMGGGGMGGGMMGGMGGGMMGGGMGGMGGGMMGGGMMGGGMMGGGMMGGGGMGGGGLGGGGMMGGGMGGIMPMRTPSMPGMGGMMANMIAVSLRQLIEQSIDPETWYDLSDYGEGTIMGYPSTAPKKLAIYQSPEVHNKIEDLLEQLRKALGHQVSIEARFLVVSENFLEDVGLDVDFNYDLGGKWGLVTVTQDSYTTGAPGESTRVPGSLGGISPAANVTGGYGSILDDLQVSFLLRATQARTDSKALAAPKVTVLSGESAIFTLTNEVSYALPPTITAQAQTSVGAGTTSTGVQNNVAIELVGSGMSVTPTIMKDKKHVLLGIQATQIDLLGFAQHTVEAIVPQTGTGAGAVAQTVPQDISVPEREVSQVMTRVSVPDNGTLLLGGHKITADVDKEVGVPILSKIPILGRAFSNRSRVRDHKILLILVKPTIILQEEREQEALAAMEGDNGGSGEY